MKKQKNPEPDLGNPPEEGSVLASTPTGERYWTPLSPRPNPSQVMITTSTQIAPGVITDSKIVSVSGSKVEVPDYSALIAGLTALTPNNSNLKTVLDDIANAKVTTASFAAGLKPIEIVATLPTFGTQGRVVFLTTDNKLYRDTGSAWTVATAGADIVANSITAGKIQAGAISTTELAAGAVRAGQIYTDAITAAGGEIANLTVGTIKIQSNAVTVPVSAYTSGQITCPGSSTTNIQSVGITTHGAYVRIDCSFLHKSGSNSSTASFYVNIVRDSTTIFTSGNIENPYTLTGVPFFTSSGFSFYDNPSGSIQTPVSHSYFLQVVCNTGVGIYATTRSLNLLELQK